ncbi:MAG: glutamate--tRNA ligase [Nitrospirae bacterium]|nr:glutamate--tRNA ligase [Candidatus Manganitrophaceae bacterium]
MSDIRVRFAPSPTGFLHIGGARTALFNWLFARHHGGKFFLRIEDTDRSRSTDEAIEAIIDGMRWLGLDWDKWEGSDKNPVRQTDRFDLYRKKVEELLDRGLAYRCYCTAEELDARRKEAMAQGKVPRYDGRCRLLTAPIPGKEAAIRFKASSEGEIVVDDLVKGKVVFDASTVDDLIILRSDGTPTYNFCVVVDDVDMKISHVIRGDDHLNNTPRQIQLYQVLNYPLPRFGHVSMILGADKARLSKRHGATAVQQYRDEGFLPEAMVNYLVRLGWSAKDQEIFSLPELIEKFTIEQVGASAATFNPEKLLWLNAHYIRTVDPKRVAQLLLPHLEQLGVSPEQIDRPRLEQIVIALRERSRTLKEMADLAVHFFVDAVPIDEKAQKVLTPETLPIFKAVHARLAETDFEHTALEEAFRSIGEGLGLKLSQVAQPVRAAVTGKTVSPGIFDVLILLGKEKTLKRLASQIDPLSSPPASK